MLLLLFSFVFFEFINLFSMMMRNIDAFWFCFAFSSTTTTSFGYRSCLNPIFNGHWNNGRIIQVFFYSWPLFMSGPDTLTIELSCFFIPWMVLLLHYHNEQHPHSPINVPNILVNNFSHFFVLFFHHHHDVLIYYSFLDRIIWI